MNKTLHKKLSGKHQYAYLPGSSYSGESLRSRQILENNLIHEIAGDLMQPRPEAIAFIMKMSRNL